VNRPAVLDDTERKAWDAGLLHLRPDIRVDRGETGNGPSPLTGPGGAPRGPSGLRSPCRRT